MEDTTTVSPDYQKRFNEVYTIAKYMPELAQQLTEAMKDRESNGFQDGRQQFLSEQVKDKRPAWLSGNRLAKAPQSLAKNKDRDIEPERD